MTATQTKITEPLLVSHRTSLSRVGVALSLREARPASYTSRALAHIGGRTAAGDAHFMAVGDGPRGSSLSGWSM